MKMEMVFKNCLKYIQRAKPTHPYILKHCHVVLTTPRNELVSLRSETIALQFSVNETGAKLDFLGGDVTLTVLDNAPAVKVSFRTWLGKEIAWMEGPPMNIDESITVTSTRPDIEWPEVISV